MNRGFTLLELLVVLVLVAVISATAVVGLGGLGGGQPEQEAQRLALVWNTLCEETAADARPLGLSLSALSYQAVQPGRADIWRGTPGVLYEVHALPEGLRLSFAGVEADAQPAESLAPQPQLLCLPGGLASGPVVLLSVGAAVKYRIETDPADGRLRAVEMQVKS